MFGDPEENPMNWPIKQLSDVAKVDGTMTKEYEKYANLPHIGIDSIEKNTGILSGYRTVKEDNVISPKYHFGPQHILYSKIRPALNKVAVPDFEGLCSADCYPLLPIDGFCERKFLAHVLRSDYFLRYVLSFSVRSQMPKVNRKQLEGFRFPCPPVELQRKFIILVEQSDKSKFISFKSQFIEMFGLPECNTHEYEIATIGDVVKDVHYGTAKKASEDGRYIYIRMNNITYDGELDLTDIKRIDVPEKDIAGCMVQEGDVLFNRTNSKDLVGKTCHFTGNEPMIIAGYIIRLRMNGKVLPEYISTFMNLDRSKKMLYSMAKGAVGQANINAKEVQSIPIVIPPENVQQEFLKLRKQSDKSK